MNLKRKVNNLIITVKKWDNKVTVTNALTGEQLDSVQFSDHITAITVARTI